MPITIVTDSTCDLPGELLKASNIKFIPLHVVAGDKDYRDRTDISTDELYQLIMDDNVRLTTSQPSIAEFTEFYKSIPGEILSLHISSTLSGTSLTAARAAESLGDDGKRITVYDTKNISLNMGLLLLRAAQLAEAGKNSQEIIEDIKALNEKVHLHFTLTSLKYLSRGGRISKAQAALGNFLKVRPLLTYEDNEVKVTGKVFGTDQAIAKIADIAKKDDEISPIQRIFIAHGHSPELQKKMDKKIRSVISHDMDIMYAEIGAVIGCHVGPGAVGIFYCN